MIRGSFIVAVLLAAAPVPAPAQEDDPKAAPAETDCVVRVVRAEDDTPLEGALVESYDDVKSPPTTAVTGRDGRAWFYRRRSLGVLVLARAPGRECDWCETRPAEDWREGWREGLADPVSEGKRKAYLELRRGSRLEGRVLSARDGKPVAGALIEARVQSGSSGRPAAEEILLWSATADGKGRFRTDEHPAIREVEDLRFRPDAMLTVRARPWRSKEVLVRGGEKDVMDPVDIRLDPGATIRGVVLGPEGKPEEEAEVLAVPEVAGKFPDPPGRERPEVAVRCVKATTGADGLYALQPVEVGVRYFVYAAGSVAPPASPGAASLNDFVPVPARSEVAAGVTAAEQGAEAPCDLRLRRLGALEVRVPRQGGGLVVALKVELRPPEGAILRFESGDTTQGSRFSGLDPGTYALKVDATGWRASVQTVEVAEGAKIERTVLLERGAALEGMVADEAGAPVPHLRLFASPVDPSDPAKTLEDDEEAWTDEEGKFRFEGLTPGVNVVVLGKGIKPYVLDPALRVMAPGKDLRITVRAK